MNFEFKDTPANCCSGRSRVRKGRSVFAGVPHPGRIDPPRNKHRKGNPMDINEFSKTRGADWVQPPQRRTNYPIHMPRRERRFQWTDFAVFQMEILAKEGLSAADIARRLGAGVSRNAVIGKCHRMGIALGALQSGNKREQKDRAARELERTRQIEAAAAAAQIERLEATRETKEAWQCARPGCRFTKQPNRRGLCATHESQYLDDVRAARQAEGIQGNAGRELFTSPLSGA
jgi:GcrA cell cycle regulator